MSAQQKLQDYNEFAESHRPVQSTGNSNDLGCGGNCTRGFLIAMNIFFLVLGAVIVGVGAYTINSSTDQIASKQIPIAAIVLGATVIAVSVLGCCGAKANSRSSLCIYAVILVLVIITQIVVASIILFDSSTADSWLTSGWNSSSNSVRVSAQNEFTCCGLQTFNDTSAGSPCPVAATDPCLSKLKSDINSKLNILGAIGIVFAVLELLGVIFALCLRNRIATQQTSHKEQSDLEDAKKVNRSY